MAEHSLLLAQVIRPSRVNATRKTQVRDRFLSVRYEAPIGLQTVPKRDVQPILAGLPIDRISKRLLIDEPYVDRARMHDPNTEGKTGQCGHTST